MGLYKLSDKNTQKTQGKPTLRRLDTGEEARENSVETALENRLRENARISGDTSGEAWNRATKAQTRIPEAKKTADRDWSTYGMTGTERRERTEAPKRKAGRQTTAPPPVNISGRDTGGAAERQEWKPDSVTPSGLNRAALNETVNRAIKATPQSGSSYSFGKSLAGAWEKGWNQFAQAGGNTFAMLEDAALAPLEFLQGMQPGDLSDNAPFNTWARSIRSYGDTLKEKYRENMAAGGMPAEIVENLGAATIAALPQAVAAFGSMGGSVAAKGAEGLARMAASETAPGIAGTLANGLTDMVRNPQYWSSFAQVAGNGYEKALSDLRARAAANGEPVNEGEIRRKAIYYAVGNGLMNAAVEISGGIQNLPKQLQNGSSGWLAWLDSTAGEGGEELWQGVIERALENVVYNQNNPMFSTKDPRAVLNPVTSAKEFGGGFFVGGLLGGIPAVINSAANRAGKIAGRGAEQTRVDEDAFLEGFLDGDGEAAKADWGAAIQADGGLLAAPDLQELYVSALQNSLGRLRISEGWMADRAASALYQEYFRRAYGAQSVIPLLPEWRGGGLEDSADIEGGMLVPMLRNAAFPGQSVAEQGIHVENPVESDIIEDILIHKSLGARARNYRVYDPKSGKYYYFVEGTRIKNPKVFAGKGGVKPLRPETVEGLCEQIGGKPSEWQHCKGLGIIDFRGEDRCAEVHWFQEATVGKHRFQIKRWLEE